MTFVLDASLALAWCFEDETTDVTERALDDATNNGAIVPFLWRAEVANGLQSAIRRRRIDAAYRNACLADLAALPIVEDLDGVDAVWTSALALAELHGLTIYDACYLELAKRKGIALATLDGALIKACRAEATPLLLA